MPIAAAGLIAAGTIGGAMISSNAAGKAADAQSAAAKSSLDFNRQVYNTNQQNFGDYKTRYDAVYGGAGDGSQSVFAPYMGVGNNAASTLSSIYGFNGSGGPGSGVNWDKYIDTPDYQFSLQQGVRALDMSAASKHLLNSGGEARDVTAYGAGMAGQQFGSTIQRLLAMMGQGQQAAGQFAGGVQSFGQTAAAFGGVNNGTGANIGNNNQSLGNAQAGGIMGQANPWVSALNTGPGNALGAYKYFGGNTGGAGGVSASSYQSAMPGNYNPNQLGGIY